MSKTTTHTSLTKKLLERSRLKRTPTTLEDSTLYSGKEHCMTPVPIMNVALSGRVDGGLTSGLTVLAGPSKHFKSTFGLVMIAAYMKKNPDSVLMFYDNEFGAPPAYFEAAGIPIDRVIHNAFTNIEELKFDLTHQLDELSEDDDVIVFIDSVGNAASKKEVEDAAAQKSTADMTRAKQLKSLFRICTPHFTMKAIPCIVINHTYKSQDMYPKDIVSGGTGIYYSADTIWVIGRQQDKDGSELQGYHFVIKIEKSRFVREGSKLPVTVNFNKGVSKWSGLLELAEEAGIVVKPKNGWYVAVDKAKYVPEVKENGKVIKEAEGLLTNVRRESQTHNRDFWETIFTKTDFAQWIKQKFTLAHVKLISEADQEDVDLDQVEDQQEDEFADAA